MRELRSADGLGGPGKAPPRIADRKADGLRAHVEAGKLAVRHRGRELGRAAGDQRRQAASLRSASLPDGRPEQCVVVDVIIVAGQDERAERRNLAVEQQQAVVAARAHLAGLQRRLPHVGRRNQRARHWPEEARRHPSCRSAG